MSQNGAQWLGQESLMLLLKCSLHAILFPHFPETLHMQLSQQLASELKSTKLQFPVKFPSEMLIEGDRAHFKEFFQDSAML